MYECLVFFKRCLACSSEKQDVICFNVFNSIRLFFIEKIFIIDNDIYDNILIVKFSSPTNQNPYLLSRVVIVKHYQFGKIFENFRSLDFWQRNLLDRNSMCRLILKFHFLRSSQIFCKYLCNMPSYQMIYQLDNTDHCERHK